MMNNLSAYSNRLGWEIKARHGHSTGPDGRRHLAPSAYSLYHGGFDLYCHRPLQHLDRQQKFAPVFLAQQYPFQPSQWTCRNPDTITASEEWVGLNSDGILYHGADRIDFCTRNGCWLSSKTYYGMNTWSGQDGKPVDEGPAKEYITREQRKRNSLDAVLPLMRGRIQGQEGFKPFPRKHSVNTLLVLMASVKSVPAVAGVHGLHR
jgi:hypothetical protein